MSYSAYDSDAAVAYARTWAMSRNPQYYDYEKLGGDCSNFASQCIYTGSGVMNYKTTFGWYYVGANNHSPSWTGVEFLYDFLTRKTGVGPFGKLVDLKDVQIGDISQFSSTSKRFSHTQVIVSVGKLPTLENTLIAAHSVDSLDRALSTYPIRDVRFIHIEGVRK
jgi:hypothetical protein